MYVHNTYTGLNNFGSRLIVEENKLSPRLIHPISVLIFKVFARIIIKFELTLVISIAALRTRRRMEHQLSCGKISADRNSEILLKVKKKSYLSICTV